MQQLYPWLTPVWKKWQALSEGHAVSGAMLCSSAQGTGLHTLATFFANTLVCRNSTSDPCGFCHSCDLTKSENHPDIHWITPEKEGKNITVEQIRQCNRWAQESSQLGGKRVIIISPAEAMNESASNALLKTLESPAEQCVFLLLSRNKNKLLPTIISRCQKWHIAEPNLNETYQWLSQQAQGEVSYHGIRLSQGAPLTALHFFDNGEYKTAQELENSLLLLLQNSSCDYGAVWKHVKDDVLIRLGWLALLLADVQKVHFNIGEQGLSPAAESLAQVISYQAAYNAGTTLAELRKQLAQFSGLNSELLFINWLIQLQEEICL
ncbi:DNA polymerase III subunit delta' [Vibrio sp. SCSIO 43137]|uniref:DNA polymerase III subunit delta' n=1 Tax=Vibrio sp. SCSIO 43137 TaxID=3021011 RepID=UPI0023078429|nr:DNA polymerase III subunit delta' [Vibrio sp. SCSIO 43137]WCE30638.1 DNA polymerase III subunit delta' [Vibrio sp. SCSIO 43137]